MPGYIHHIEWCVSDLEHIRNKLIVHYGFTEIGFRETPACLQSALRSGQTVFLVTQRRPAPQRTSPRGYPELFCCSDVHSRDSVFNVCLQVDNVDAVVDRCAANGARVLRRPESVESDEGSIRLGVVSSCCGNVVHSIIDAKSYSGFFLPGFEPSTLCAPSPNPDAATTFMDHVTYVCRTGESRGIIEWYKKCFGMERFLVNSQETIEEGIVIEHEVGMRMMVGEWLSQWLCRETGVQTSPAEEQRNFKLVLAEPLKDREDSHVQKFLDWHGGPGLQHIGLMTDDMIKTVNAMTEDGGQFRKPPPTYYKMTSKMEEILSADGDIPTFSRLGVLLDSEADLESSDAENKSKFLLQIFTKPIFEQDTFFLEVLQRRGARGFGAGNITALARSIVLYQLEQQSNNVLHGPEVKG